MQRVNSAGLEKTHEILEENGLTDNGMESAKKLGVIRSKSEDVIRRGKTLDDSFLMYREKLKVLTSCLRLTQEHQKP